MTRRGWLLFAAMGVLWGLPYLFIRVAVRELAPATLVCARCLLGALLLTPFAVRRGTLAPLLRRWRPLLAFTVLEVTGPWLLLSDAERRLPSSLTGLLVAGVPLVAAVASRLTGAVDRLDAARLAGLGVGLLGVGALVGLDVHGGDLTAAGELGLVILGYGTAPLVISRSLGDVPSLQVIAAALGVTALVYAPVAATHLPTRVPPATVLVSIGLLAVLCTAAAFVLFFALIAEAGPNRALVITFVNPAVAVLLGVLLLGEPLTRGTLVGFPLVLLGCVLATRRGAPRGAVAAAPTAEPVSV